MPHKSDAELAALDQPILRGQGIEVADEVAVMYAGRIVEIGPVEEVTRRPSHPYTAGLMASIPSVHVRHEHLNQIDGAMPRLNAIPPGCAFNARCRRRFGPCTQLQPQLKDYGGQLVACFAVDQDENPQR